uniref:Photosystem II reaction center protein M n=4 Tax=Calocedrus TaxID=13386 RepID=N0DR32_CALFM|nr:photosystem II M protein [Calocedrus formosana]YP_009758669.1 photosystem II protein M [Calocedrus rupestris]AQM38891.1 photosystem II protein M [Calocedrus macrolepis]AQM38808.1 photosystem II protein M [Calocedrus formosana]QIN90486.1 photosystem II protein M [Calocedrus rupestris]BAN16984.1 photosystem II M protein [Calocedrus formosana]BAO19868.1 photosystem II M protein [Calocedrus formosana]
MEVNNVAFIAILLFVTVPTAFLIVIYAQTRPQSELE